MNCVSVNEIRLCGLVGILRNMYLDNVFEIFDH